MTILGSPKLGASFVDYLVSIGEGGRNLAGFGGEGVETFFFLFEGKVRVWNEDKEEVIGKDVYKRQAQWNRHTGRRKYTSRHKYAGSYQYALRSGYCTRDRYPGGSKPAAQKAYALQE